MINCNSSVKWFVLYNCMYALIVYGNYHIINIFITSTDKDDNWYHMINVSCVFIATIPWPCSSRSRRGGSIPWLLVFPCMLLAREQGACYQRESDLSAVTLKKEDFRGSQFRLQGGRRRRRILRPRYGWQYQTELDRRDCTWNKKEKIWSSFSWANTSSMANGIKCSYEVTSPAKNVIRVNKLKIWVLLTVV